MNLLEFYDLFASSKQIAIVGNSATALNSKLGKSIDACNAVVRFNAARINGYEKYVGSRTDILFVTGSLKSSSAELNPHCLVVMIRPRAVADPLALLQRFSKLYPSAHVFYTIAPDVNVPCNSRTRHYTTGTYATHLLMSMAPKASFTITGFNMFGEGGGLPSNYWREHVASRAFRKHDIIEEARTFSKIVNRHKGKLTLGEDVSELLKRNLGTETRKLPNRRFFKPLEFLSLRLIQLGMLLRHRIERGKTVND